MIDDLIARLQAGAEQEHDDHTVFAEAADEINRLTAALASERERAEVMSALAKKLGNTLMSFTPGGSEYFTKVAGDYYADAEACAVIIHDRMRRAIKFAGERNAALAERDALARRVTELEGALRPFADLADHIGKTTDVGTAEDWWQFTWAAPKYGDLKAARAVLKKENAGVDTDR